MLKPETNGYYWVRFGWGWEPARWDGGEWLRFGIELNWNYDVLEIGPQVEYRTQSTAAGDPAETVNQEMLATLRVMVDQIDGDPRAAQFFDLRWLEKVKAVIREAGKQTGAQSQRAADDLLEKCGHKTDPVIERMLRKGERR